jgi:O-antigen/teichoic acid export membrane protein
MTSVLRKGAIGLLDQGMSSLSNVLAVVMVAQGLSASAFGSFSVAYAVLIFLLTLTRSYFGTQLTLTETQSAAIDRARSTLGALLMLAPVPAVVVGMVGMLLANENDLSITFVVAVAAPIVCLQDLLRYAAIAVERPLVALASDTVWTIIVALPALGLVGLTGTAILAVWLGAAVLALAIAFVLLRIRPNFVQGRQLLRQRHAVGNSMTIGAVAVSAASLVIAVTTAHFLSPSSAGSLRGASTAMGPLNVLFAFVTLNLTPTLLRRSRSRDLTFCVRVSVLVAAAVVVWAAIILLLPDAVGRSLLGASWPGARSVLPWTCVEYLFLGISMSTMLWLRVRYASRQLLQKRLTYAAILVILGAGAAILGPSVIHVAAAVACAAFINAAMGWLLILRNRSLDLTPTPDADLQTPTVGLQKADQTDVRTRAGRHRRRSDGFVRRK